MGLKGQFYRRVGGPKSPVLWGGGGVGVGLKAQFYRRVGGPESPVLQKGGWA